MTSTVASLPTYETNTTFNVSWSGTDTPTHSSGLQNYTIYVSDNGGSLRRLADRYDV